MCSRPAASRARRLARPAGFARAPRVRTPDVFAPRGFAPLDWPGFTPYEVAKLLMEPGFFQGFQSAQWPRFWRLWDIDDGPGWLATFSIMSLVIYTILAGVLTRDALRRFEIVAGRARRRHVEWASPTGVPQLIPLGDAHPA